MLSMEFMLQGFVTSNKSVPFRRKGLCRMRHFKVTYFKCVIFECSGEDIGYNKFMSCDAQKKFLTGDYQ